MAFKGLKLIFLIQSCKFGLITAVTLQLDITAALECINIGSYWTFIVVSSCTFSEQEEAILAH